jgi:hypothetical protein
MKLSIIQIVICIFIIISLVLSIYSIVTNSGSSPPGSSPPGSSPPGSSPPGSSPPGSSPPGSSPPGSSPPGSSPPGSSPPGSSPPGSSPPGSSPPGSSPPGSSPPGSSPPGSSPPGSSPPGSSPPGSSPPGSSPPGSSPPGSSPPGSSPPGSSPPGSSPPGSSPPGSSPPGSSPPGSSPPGSSPPGSSPPGSSPPGPSQPCPTRLLGSQTNDTWYNIFQVSPDAVDEGDGKPGYGYKDKLNDTKNPMPPDFKTRLSDRVATALWLDSTKHSKTRFTKALKWMKDNDKTNIIVIVYNVPNRDCHAVASNGELCCSDFSAGKDYCDPDTQRNFQKQFKKDTGPTSECIQLESTGNGNSYQEYIDGIRDTINNYCEINFKLIIEPDCFSNVITNCGLAPSAKCENPGEYEPTNLPSCGNCGPSTAFLSYLPGINYAINTLSECTNAELFLDVAHPLWLGWDLGIADFKNGKPDDKEEKGLMSTLLGGIIYNEKFKGFRKPDSNVVKYLSKPFQYDTTKWLEKLTGFATNVSNYIPLGEKDDYAKEYFDGLNNGSINDNFVQWCSDHSSANGCYKGKPPCNNFIKYNPSTNLRNYAALLNFIFAKKMKGRNNPIIYADTSRNGKMSEQYSSNITNYSLEEPCASWCNVFGDQGPTIGEPTFNESGDFNQYNEQDYLYLMYLKPPGESDGCVNPDEQKKITSPQPTAGKASPKVCQKLGSYNNSACARFDTMCGISGTRGFNDGKGTDTEMAICPPEAGMWDQTQMNRLINNFK